MRYLTHITLAATMLANSAHALSCMRPNLARSFNQIVESKDSYYVAYGTLKNTHPIVDPNRNATNINEKKSYSVDAEFTGRFMGRTGFGTPIQKPVRVDIKCLASWCGGFPNSPDDMLVFIKKTSNGLVTTTGPCGGGIKVAPSDKELRILKSCMRKGACSDRQIKQLN